eukprot:GHVS01004176.1.p1 GENE.GHVS01004176.1~~GHVS01004176.1.p1  ORF type:complete len:522 (+),score=125.38 GHVS01004176.1:99-1664(+)
MFCCVKDRWSPEAVEFSEGVVEISCGNYHMAVRTAAGRIATVGDGGDGRLGPAKRTQEVLQRVRGVPTCRSVECGGSHTGVVDEELNVWIWGSDSCGQLGLGQGSQTVPRKMDFFEGKGVCSLSFGEHQSAAVTLSGLLYVWGGCRQTTTASTFRQQALPGVVEEVLLTPVVRVAVSDMGIFTISATVHNPSSFSIFDSWRRAIHLQDEKARTKAQKSFRDQIEKTQRDRNEKTSEIFRLDQLAESRRRRQLRDKHETRRLAVQEGRATGNESTKRAQGGLTPLTLFSAESEDGQTSTRSNVDGPTSEGCFKEEEEGRGRCTYSTGEEPATATTTEGKVVAIMEDNNSNRTTNIDVREEECLRRPVQSFNNKGALLYVQQQNSPKVKGNKDGRKKGILGARGMAEDVEKKCQNKTKSTRLLHQSGRTASLYVQPPTTNDARVVSLFGFSHDDASSSLEDEMTSSEFIKKSAACLYINQMYNSHYDDNATITPKPFHVSPYLMPAYYTNGDTAAVRTATRRL